MSDKHTKKDAPPPTPKFPPARMPLSDQIARIATLEEGWYGGQQGPRFNAAFLAQVEAFLQRAMRDYGAPLPRVFPSLDGEISVEWAGDPWIGIMIEPASDLAEMSSGGTVDNIIEEINWKHELAPKRLAEFVAAQMRRQS